MQRFRSLWLALGMLFLPGMVHAQQNTAMVRIMHAVPDAPAVDVFVDDQRVFANATFPSIGAYVAVPAGEHTISIVPTGQTRSDAILESQVTLDAGQAYSIAAVGIDDTSIEVLKDDLSAPAASKARVRIIHYSPDAPGANVEVINGPTLVGDLAFKELSPYLDVDAGTYNIRLVTAGANTVIVQLPNTTFAAGTIYDVVAAGRLANIQVAVGAYTAPTAQANAQAASAPTPTQVVMPAAGVTNEYNGVFLGSLLMLALGITMRAAEVLMAHSRSRVTDTTS